MGDDHQDSRDLWIHLVFSEIASKPKPCQVGDIAASYGYQMQPRIYVQEHVRSTEYTVQSLYSPCTVPVHVQRCITVPPYMIQTWHDRTQLSANRTNCY